MVPNDILLEKDNVFAPPALFLPPDLKWVKHLKDSALRQD